MVQMERAYEPMRATQGTLALAYGLAWACHAEPSHSRGISSWSEITTYGYCALLLGQPARRSLAEAKAYLRHPAPRPGC